MVIRNRRTLKPPPYFRKIRFYGHTQLPCKKVRGTSTARWFLVDKTCSCFPCKLGGASIFPWDSRSYGCCSGNSHSLTFFDAFWKPSWELTNFNYNTKARHVVPNSVKNQQVLWFAALRPFVTAKMSVLFSGMTIIPLCFLFLPLVQTKNQNSFTLWLNQFSEPKPSF